MLQNHANGVSWYEFELLKRHPQVRNASFTRKGGISQNHYFGLNLSDTVGDEPVAVQENIRRAFSQIGLNCPHILAQQVHGAHVQHVEAATIGKIPSCDALSTNKRGLALCIQHADCQAAIFFDPVTMSIACVHSGWKGSCQNIYKATLDQMRARYGSDAKDIIVCISPSLGPSASEFIHYRQELPEQFWRFKDARDYFDFWSISRWQLEQEGVQPENIEIAGLCTFSDAEQFYSYRRERPCGRHLTTVWLT